MALDAGAVFVRLGGVFERNEFDRYDRAVADARSEARSPVEQKLGADSSGLDRDMAQAKTKLSAWSRDETKTKVGVDQGFFDRAMAAARSKFQTALSGFRGEATIKVDLDTSAVEAKIALMKAELAALGRGEITRGVGLGGLGGIATSRVMSGRTGAESGGLMGVRGSAGVGSADNPVTVTIEAGRFAGIGPRAAEIAYPSGAEQNPSTPATIAAAGGPRQGAGQPTQEPAWAKSLALDLQKSRERPGAIGGPAYGGHAPATVGRAPSLTGTAQEQVHLEGLPQAQAQLKALHGVAQEQVDLTGIDKAKAAIKALSEKITIPVDLDTKAAMAKIAAMKTAMHDSVRGVIGGGGAGDRGGSGGGGEGPPGESGAPGAPGDDGGGGMGGVSRFLFGSGRRVGGRFTGPLNPFQAGIHGPLGFVGGAAGLGPEHLVGAGLAVGGSAAGAAAGGAVTALGGLGTLAVGGGSDAAVLKSTIADTKTLYTNYQQLQTAITRYGAGSRQAAQATAALNAQMANLGGGVGVKAEMQLAKAASALNDQWDKATQNARVQAVNILNQVLGLGRTYVPKVAQAAQQNLAIINKSIQPLFQWLEGPHGIKIWDDLENKFKSLLPTSVHAFTQSIELLLKVIDDASKYAGGFIKTWDQLATRWNTMPASELSAKIARLHNDFKIWEDLIKNAGRDLFDLFHAGAGEGNELVIKLDDILKRWGEWEHSAKGQTALKTFFVNRKLELEAVLTVVGQVAKMFGEVWVALQPLVPAITMFAREVSTALGATLVPLVRVAAEGLSAILKIFVSLGSSNGPLGSLSSLFRDAIIAPLGVALISARLFGAKKTWGIITELPVIFSGIGLTIARVFGGDFRGAMDSLKSTWARITGKGPGSPGQSIKEGVVEGAKEGGQIIKEDIIAGMKEGGAAAGGEMEGGTAAGGAKAGAEIEGAEAAGGAKAGSEISAAEVAGGAKAGAEEAAGTAEGGLAAGGLGGIGGKAKGLLSKIPGVGKIVGGGAAAEGATAAEGAAGAGAAGAGGLLLPVVGGMVVGSAAQHATGLRGGTGGTVGGGAIGAAIGTAIEPGIGTAIGAAVGATFGPSFIHAVSNFFGGGPSYGKKIADAVTKGFGNNVDKSVHDGIQKSLDDADKLMAKHKPRASGLGIQLPAPKWSDKDQQRLDDDMRKAGTKAASQLEAGWNQHKFLDAPTMVKQFTATMKKLPDQAKAYAAESSIKFLQEMERQGRAAPGTAKRFLQGIERQFPGLTRYLGTSAAQASHAFNTNFNLKKAEASVQTTVNQIRQHFSVVDDAVNRTKGNTDVKVAAMIRALNNVYKNGTGPMRKQAAADIQALQQVEAQKFDAMANDTEAKMALLSSSVQKHSSSAQREATKDFNTLAANVKNAMGSGIISAQQGSQLIDQAVAQALKTFGVTNIPKLALEHSGQIAGLIQAGETPSAAYSYAIRPNAQGGYLPGSEYGYDDSMVLVDPMGRPRAKMAGDEAIYNRHQQPYVEAGLKAIGFTGGSEELWNRVNRPHGYEKGGRLPKFAKGGQGFSQYSLPLPKSEMMPGSWSFDQGVDIPAPANTPEFAIGPGVITGEGITGFGPNAPILRVDQGPLAGTSFYYGHAGPNKVPVGAHVTAGQQISEVGAGIVGISTGPHIEFGIWPPVGGARVATLLNQLMSGSTVTPVGGGGGGGAGPVWTNIKSPKVRGKGRLHDAVQKGLDKATDAANKWGAAKAGASGAAGATAGGYTAEPGGWFRIGATLDPTSGQGGFGGSGMTFAELLEAGTNAGMRPDITQLLGKARGSYGMPMGTSIGIRMPGSQKAFHILKNDVGSGQAGNPHFKIDLHPGIASALGWTPNQDVEVHAARGAQLNLVNNAHVPKGKVEAFQHAINQQAGQLSEYWSTGPISWGKSGWPVILSHRTDPRLGGDIGRHIIEKGVPTAVVAADASTPWQLVGSHEVMEMLVNPKVTATMGGMREEIADPVKGMRYNIAGVPVSDFVTPAWFTGKSTGPFDYLHRIHSSKGKSSKGYDVKAATGGLLPGFRTGGNLRRVTRRRSSTPTHSRVPAHKKPPTPASILKSIGTAPPGMAKYQALANTFAADDVAAAKLESRYNQEQSLFQLYSSGSSSGQFMPQDLANLMGLQESEWDVYWKEYGSLQGAINELTAKAGTLIGHTSGYRRVQAYDRHGHPIKGKTVNKWVPGTGIDATLQQLNQDNILVTQLQNDIRDSQQQTTAGRYALSTRAANLSDAYARQISSLADAVIADQQGATNITYQIANLTAQLPSTFGEQYANIQNRIQSLQVQRHAGSRSASLYAEMTKVRQRSTIARNQLRKEGYDFGYAQAIKKHKLQDKLHKIQQDIKKLNDLLKAEQKRLAYLIGNQPGSVGAETGGGKRGQQPIYPSASDVTGGLLQTLETRLHGSADGSQGSLQDTMETVAQNILGLVQQGGKLDDTRLGQMKQLFSDMGIPLPQGFGAGGLASDTQGLQAMQDLQSFQSALANIFNTYGSNFTPAGINPFATAAGQAAGVRYYGAAAGGSGDLSSTPAPAQTSSQGTTINMEMNFAAGPPAPNTFAHGLRYELGAQI